MAYREKKVGEEIRILLLREEKPKRALFNVWSSHFAEEEASIFISQEDRTRTSN